MSYKRWPKRDPNKNYFLVPNEVFHIGLSYPEISVYCYLLSIEDRETYQCWPSYKTIGKALGMSENTVSKYVRSLEEDTARQRAAERLAELARESPQNALCAPFGAEASPSAEPGLEAEFGPLSGVFPGTKEKAG